MAGCCLCADAIEVSKNGDVVSESCTIMSKYRSLHAFHQLSVHAFPSCAFLGESVPTIRTRVRRTYIPTYLHAANKKCSAVVFAPVFFFFFQTKHSFFVVFFVGESRRRKRRRRLDVSADYDDTVDASVDAFVVTAGGAALGSAMPGTVRIVSEG